ncbi:MAG: glycosyltransferase family 39 protein [Maricaulis sp.]|nr:glycosyltransferase family 39 protein [Maricaulis sp.]
MTQFESSARPFNWSWERATIALILIATMARIIALLINPLTLHADETQYWIWSQNFDWGYFSKPPMIAWLIGLSTSLFGNADWAVRMPTPFLHAATSSFIALIALRLWDERTAFWTCLAYLTLPAIWLSSSIISTDALLLCAWTGGLWALLRLRDGEGWPSAVGLGLAIGLGFLSKYAMIYFLVGTGIAMVIDAPTRLALLTRNGLIAGVLAAVLFAPNILWNAAHDFATVSHTAANANWGGSLGNPMELAEFIVGQFGVFGLIFFPILLVVLIVTLREFRTTSPNALLLAGYTLPPLIVVSVQSFISRAHANWAVAAYVAGTLLLVSFLLRGGRWRRMVLIGSIALHSVMGATMMIMVANPGLVEAVGASNSTKRIRGWHETAGAITSAGMAEEFDMVVFDDRNVFHQTQRYAPLLTKPLAMWQRFSGPSNHAEQIWPLENGSDASLLIVSHRPLEVARMREDFDNFVAVGSISIPLDGDKTREFTLWHARGYNRVLRDAAYEERWLAVDAAQ